MKTKEKANQSEHEVYERARFLSLRDISKTILGSNMQIMSKSWDLKTIFL